MWFDHVTGFFVNYGWKPGNLTNTVQYMATNVTGRQFSDVYIGIDVWGRNVTGNFCLDKFICKQSTITKHTIIHRIVAASIRSILHQEKAG